MQEFDYVIVGAGVVGLGIARALVAAKPGASLLIVDKESLLGAHASGRNSGVLHAGLYYKPGTLKAQLCVEGARRMKAYCQEKGLPLKTLGKVIIPTEASAADGLETIWKNASANGVVLERLDNQGLRDLEPAVHPEVQEGLYSPATAVVDPKEVLKALKDELIAGGAQFRLGEEVRLISRSKRQVATNRGCYGYKHLINAAGAYADVLAHKLGCGLDFTILPFRGLYYKLAPLSGLHIRGNIYPVPDLRVPFLGVHFTRSVHGDVYVGPTAIPALGREQYRGLKGFSFEDSAGILRHLAGQFLADKNGFRKLVSDELPKLTLRGFYRAAAALVPTLKMQHLIACEKVGIRAQLFNIKKGELEMDFYVEKGENSTHILNAVSPAFTSSLTFGQHVVDTYVP